MASPTHIPSDLALLLQRVADGQASDADLEQYASALERDPDLVHVVEGQQALAAHVRSALMAEASSVDFGAARARVMAQVGTGGWRAALARFWNAQRWVLVPTLAGAVAVTLAVGVPALVDPVGELPPSGDSGNVATTTEIHSLDVEDGTAVVFQTPSSNLTVIWLNTSEEQDDVPAPEEVDSELLDEQDTAVP